MSGITVDVIGGSVYAYPLPGTTEMLNDGEANTALRELVPFLLDIDPDFYRTISEVRVDGRASVLLTHYVHVGQCRDGRVWWATLTAGTTAIPPPEYAEGAYRAGLATVEVVRETGDFDG